MLIDWLSMVYEVQDDDGRELVKRLSQGRDVCLQLSSSEVIKEWFPRTVKRSDSHTLDLGLTRNRITLDGSPARLYADNNVFGSLDVKDCARRMIRAASQTANAMLPPLEAWRCTRVDLCQNFDCWEAGASHVRSALASLSKVAGGHLKASAFRDSVYWNKHSPLWSAKAYAKGPHLKTLVRNGKATATDEQLQLADRILRLEVTIKNRTIKAAHLNWDTMAPEALMTLYRDVAEKIIPPNVSDVSHEQQLAALMVERFGVRKGRNLLAVWGLIKTIGLEATQERIGRSQWFVRLSQFRELGLSLGDLQTGQILSFRPRQILARPVDSWADLRRAA